MTNLMTQINDILEKCRTDGTRAVVALDGMSASGKTTLAAELAENFGGAVIHTDDFHLPFHLRTAPLSSWKEPIPCGRSFEADMIFPYA